MKYIFWLIGLIIIAGGALWFFNPGQVGFTTEIPDTLTSVTPTPTESGLTLEEKYQIEAWIDENNLNQYGEAKDTVYTAGAPLYDAATGQTLDRYEYILKNHPDRPWRSE